MKKLSLIVFIFIFLSGAFHSCKEDIAETEECLESADGCGGEYTACCTRTSCYYLYNGVKYPCEGTDCTEAAIELADDLCAKDLKKRQFITVDDILKSMPCK